MADSVEYSGRVEGQKATLLNPSKTAILLIEYQNEFTTTGQFFTNIYNNNIDSSINGINGNIFLI